MKSKATIAEGQSVGTTPDAATLPVESVKITEPPVEKMEDILKAGDEINGCVLVDKALFARLYHACIQNRVESFSRHAGLANFARMLGLPNGNDEQNRELYLKFRDVVEGISK